MMIFKPYFQHRLSGKRIYLILLTFLLTWAVQAQETKITVSGSILDPVKKPVPFVNVILKTEKDSTFVTGTITDESGRYSLSDIHPGNYNLEISYVGHSKQYQSLFVGNLTSTLELPPIELQGNTTALDEVLIAVKSDKNVEKMDKKTYSVAENISQSGGSVMQVMQNLPGISVQDGKIQLRGNEKVTVLIDGKQTALTGFGGQSGLDNIPASAIQNIEIINNPSARYDANGNGGIINIIYKKNKQNGFNGKIGLTTGLGALWVRQENLPGIRPQYQATPKINPSVSLNYRKDKVNFFFQGDYLFTHTLNKNEFVTRTYDDGSVIRQQTKRNRETGFLTLKAGADWEINANNTLTISGLFSSEKIIDRGDQPFFNQDLSQRYRLWQFLEDELKTTAMFSSSYLHKFKEAGHQLNIGFNYTFHREDEKYFFDNIMPDYTGKDAFKLVSDEHVADFTADYIRPLKYGRIEGGIKFRRREIPTDMQFFPGINSPLDVNAGGWATYKETIPALYGNYVFENKKFEAELGLRLEYVNLQYDVNPGHNTYTSNGYNYTQPFPNFRLAYKVNDRNKLSVFYSRRVDRPNEIDIRIFPKYDDAEIIKVGNPDLRPQFTNSVELGYKNIWEQGSLYSAVYHRFANGTITRISSTVPGSTLIYAIFQNVNESYNTGIETLLTQKINSWFKLNWNANLYQNQINAFTVTNKYPEIHTFSAPTQKQFSGNSKLNLFFNLPKKFDLQLTGSYQLADIIPQGKTNNRFTMDLGVKKTIQSGKGELFLNASDLLNSLVIEKEIQGDGFHYTSKDYYETQVIRFGYTYKF